MTEPRQTGRQDDSEVTMDATAGMVQIHLEELGKHSWTGAILGAVIGAAGGPPYRFVAAPTDPDRDASEHGAVRAKFPVVPFKDLEDQTQAIPSGT